MHPEQLGTYIRAHLYSLYSRLDHANADGNSDADYLEGAIEVSWHYLQKFDIPFDTYVAWQELGRPNKQENKTCSHSFLEERYMGEEYHCLDCGEEVDVEDN